MESGIYIKIAVMRLIVKAVCAKCVRTLGANRGQTGRNAANRPTGGNERTRPKMLEESMVDGKGLEPSASALRTRRV